MTQKPTQTAGGHRPATAPSKRATSASPPHPGVSKGTAPGMSGARPAPAPRRRASQPVVKREVDHSLADRLLPLSAVMEIAGLGKTMIYKKMREGTFPKCCKPGGASSRWSEAEVVEWKAAVMAAR